jgi:hypothetical protein
VPRTTAAGRGLLPTAAQDGGPGTIAPPAVPEAGKGVLRLIGTRVATLYLVSVLVAFLLSAPPDRPGHWLAAFAVLAVSSAGIITALARVLAVGPAVALVLCALGAILAVLVPPSAGLHDTQILLGALVSGVVAGTALSWGPGPGLVATAGTLTCWGCSAWLVTSMDDLLFVGALTAGLLGATGSLLLRRGYSVTHQAVTAAEDAMTARVVAAARWRARRHEIRLLHDTVLSTLCLLSQDSFGVDEAALRADCHAQALLLREAAAPSALTADVGTGRGVGTGKGRDPGNGDDPFELIRRRWAARSLDVEVFGTEESRRLRGLAPTSVSALLPAVEECLENVRRHAGVQVAVITVTLLADGVRCTVSDEGRGFDPGDVPGRRMGLGDSVIGRIHEAGGSARVWSAPGRGTCVALLVPVERLRGARCP